jgi:hypothetical protein
MTSESAPWFRRRARRPHPGLDQRPAREHAQRFNVDHTRDCATFNYQSRQNQTLRPSPRAMTSSLEIFFLFSNWSRLLSLTEDRP